MRLDKCLTLLGAGSRSYVKKLIQDGKVLKNGVTEHHPEAEVSENDQLSFQNCDETFHALVYYLMNKPAGYITAKSDPKKKTVMELLPTKRTDVSPVGRLDEDTEGLLLFTNDGELCHKLISPKYHVDKKYYAEVDADLPENAGEIFSKPIEFKEFTSAPATFEKLSERSAYLTIHEGKYHQVKRMFHHIGCEVTYLRRESFGGLDLSALQPGQVRELTEEEVKKLKS